MTLNNDAGNKELSRVALFTAGRAFNLVRSRLPVMKALKERGWQVIAAGASQAEFDEILRDEGIYFISVPYYRFSLSGFRDMKAAYILSKIIDRYNPAIVHFFNPKPILLGGIVCRLRRPELIRISTVTGMGVLNDKTLVSRAVVMAYRFALKGTDAVVFENETARKDFSKMDVACSGRSFVQISSGVDISKFNMNETNSHAGNPVKFLFASRILWSKGVKELSEAIRQLKEEFGKRIEFTFAGEIEEEHREGVPASFVNDLHESGNIRYLGKIGLKDMPALIRDSDVMVLPSYREGMSKFLMEGAAAGNALVATDIPGCREIVRDGETGWTVPVKDTTTLVATLQKLIRNPDDIVRFGKNARRLAEEQFDQDIIAQKTLEIYRQSGCPI